jgi:hypothetical protein
MRLHENTMVVGANVGRGAAYIFERLPTGTAWTQTAKLMASGAAFDASMGGAVAIYGDTVLVNSEDDDHGTDSGTVSPSPHSSLLMASRSCVCLRQSWLELVGADESRGCRWRQGRLLRAVSRDQRRFHVNGLAL